MDRDHNWEHGGAEYSETGEGEIAARVRDYLLAQGVPARFFYYFKATEDLRLVPVNEAGELIRFGLTRDQDMVCMSTVDSSVWEVSAKANGTRSLINTSLSSFLEFMAICEERISAHERVDDGDEELDEEFVERWIETSDAIRERIAGIDPSSLFDGSYWSDFLSDVENGDYE